MAQKRDDDSTATGSSEASSSFVSDVLEASGEGPVVIIDPPPPASCLTAMPELNTPLPPSSAGLDTGPKWKPLVGTPSKLPVPENIFVPDPSSPAKSISDDGVASSNMLPPSPPDSVVNLRRSGEYVQRPPVWRVFKMEDGTPPCSRDGGDDSQADPDCEIKDLEFSLNHGRADLGEGKPDFGNLDWTRLGFPGQSVENQLNKMADVFMDRPVMVNMMHQPDLPLLPPKFFVQPPTPVPSEALAGGATVRPSPAPKVIFNDRVLIRSPDFDTPDSDSIRCNAPTSPDGIPQAPSLQEDKGKATARDSQSQRTGSFGPRKTSHSIGTNTNKSSQYPANSDSSRCNSHAESNTPKIYNTALDPKRYCHFEFPKFPKDRDFIDSYTDIRVQPPEEGNPPSQNNIVRGSHVVFIGRTEFDNANGRACEIGLPMSSQFYVDRIFGDCWALCLKLEPGLEISTKRKRDLGGMRKMKPPKQVFEGVPLIPVKNHPVILVYAPLCAFTLMSNYAAFRFHLRPTGVPSTSTAYQGGLVKAAPRISSEKFEAAAKRSRVVWVSETGFGRYKSYCDSLKEPQSVFERETTAVGDFAGLEYGTVLEKSDERGSKRVKITDKNSIGQKYRDMLSRKRRRPIVDVSSQPINMPTGDVCPVFFNADSSQQKLQVISTGASPQNLERDPNLPAVLDNVPGEQNAGIDENPFEDNQSGSVDGLFAIPISRQENDEGSTGNQDDPFRDPSEHHSDQVQSADPVSKEGVSGKATKKKRKSIASRLFGRSSRTTDEKGTTPPTQEPKTRSLRKCLNDTIKSIITPGRKARPSVLPQDSDNPPRTSDEPLISVESNDASSKPPSVKDEDRDSAIVCDPSWDAEAKNKGSKRRRFKDGLNSFKAKQILKKPAPIIIMDENRGQSLVENVRQNSFPLEDLRQGDNPERFPPLENFQLYSDPPLDAGGALSSSAPQALFPLFPVAADDTRMDYRGLGEELVLNPIGNSQRPETEPVSDERVTELTDRKGELRFAGRLRDLTNQK